MARCLLVLLLVAALRAEVPGVPRLPRPGVVPDYWFHVGNDLFGLGNNDDDHRTADAAANARVVDRLLLGANYSILTNRERSHWSSQERFAYLATQFLRHRAGLPVTPHAGRIDQLTPTVGWVFWSGSDRSRRRDYRVAAGAGVRIYDDLIGDRVQNNLHRFRLLEEVDLRYEDRDEVVPVGYLSLSLSQAFDLELPQDLDPFGGGLPLGYWLEAQTLVTADGFVEGAYGAYGGIVHRRFSLWGGLRYQLRGGGRHPSPTVHATADNEDGLFGVLGFALGPFYLETGYSFENHRGYGRVGVVVTAEQMNIPHVGRGSRLAVEGQALGPEFGLGLQARWYPTKPLRHEVVTICPAVALHYRRAQVHNGDYRTHDLYGRQVAIGVDVEMALPAPFTRLRPYLGVGAGWRKEVFEVDPAWTRYGTLPHEGSSACLYADTGVRFYLRQPFEQLHATAHLGITGWLPLKERTWYHGTNRVHYLRPGINGTVGLSIDLVF